MAKAYTIENKTIILKRELTELDQFVKHFLAILTHYSDYLLVSGYVSISTGRTRGTEDVDLLIPVMNKVKFIQLFQALQKEDFWCYQSDVPEEAYEYHKDLLNIRFARKGEMFPNMEVIPIDSSRRAKCFEFNHPLKMRVEEFEFKVPPLEFEILYKEMILKGEKDIADAKHLRIVFADILLEEKFKEYKPIILRELS